MRILPPALVLVLAPFALPAADPAHDLDLAIARVKEIVNQSVTTLPVSDGQQPAMFRPGWFHPGAMVPDFDHVDVRRSQECAQYTKWPYITSDLNPGVMFPSAEVEFNANTKIFYMDRAFPKRKLTEAEMVEINGLYRRIGACLTALQAGQGPAVSEGLPRTLLAARSQRPAPAQASGPSHEEEGTLFTPHNGAMGLLGLALVGLLLWMRKRY